MTGKEERFCKAFVLYQDAKEAAIASGTLAPFARKTGLRLLEKESVRSEIRRLEEASRGQAMDAAVLAGLRRLAFGAANDTAELLALPQEELLQKLPELDLFRVSEIRKTKQDALEIKFYDRFRAMELLLEVADRKNKSASMLDLVQALGAASEGGDGEG